MARKKSNDTSSLLTKLIGVRLSQQDYDRLEKIRKNSNCQSLPEMCRLILSKKPITFFQVDASLDIHMNELILIKKEINAIGTNINQITHAFHLEEGVNQKVILALRVAEQYRLVGKKVDELTKVISQLSLKWLQK
jgi:hypothetical protein